MNQLPAILLVASLCALFACQQQVPPTETASLCSGSWYQSVESAITSGDGMGHGPDVGSEEWKSVVEFKLGIRGKPGVPDRSSQAWCSYIDDLLKRKRP